MARLASLRNTFGLVFVLAVLFAGRSSGETRYCFASLGYGFSSGISHIDCIDGSSEMADNDCPNACTSACNSNYTGDVYRPNNCQFVESTQYWSTGSPMECYCNEPM